MKGHYSNVNLTSLLDVIFITLFIVMVTTSGNYEKKEDDLQAISEAQIDIAKHANENLKMVEATATQMSLEIETKVAQSIAPTATLEFVIAKETQIAEERIALATEVYSQTQSANATATAIVDSALQSAKVKIDEVAELLQEVSENPSEVIAQYKFAEQAYTTYSISLSKDGDLEVTLGEVTVCAKKKYKGTGTIFSEFGACLEGEFEKQQSQRVNFMLKYDAQSDTLQLDKLIEVLNSLKRSDRISEYAVQPICIVDGQEIYGDCP